MPETAHVTAAVVPAAIPGPGMLYALRTLAHGRSAGGFAAAGNRH